MKKKILICMSLACVLFCVACNKENTKEVVSQNFVENETRKESKLLGDELIAKQEYDKAMEAYNNTLKQDPTNVVAYLGIVDVYMWNREYDKALEAAQNAYVAVEDERIKAKIEEMEKGDYITRDNHKLKEIMTGNVDIAFEFFYQKDSFQKEKVVATFSDGRPQQVGIYQYNDKSKVSFNQSSSSGLQMVKTEELDEYTTKQYNYKDVEGKDLSSITITVINGQKKKVNVKKYDAEESLKSETKYYYDNLNRQTRTEVYQYPENILDSYTVTEYYNEIDATQRVEYSYKGSDNSLKKYQIYNGDKNKKYEVDVPVQVALVEMGIKSTSIDKADTSELEKEPKVACDINQIINDIPVCYIFNESTLGGTDTSGTQMLYEMISTYVSDYYGKGKSDLSRNEYPMDEYQAYELVYAKPVFIDWTSESSACFGCYVLLNSKNEDNIVAKLFVGTMDRKNKLWKIDRKSSDFLEQYNKAIYPQSVLWNITAQMNPIQKKFAWRRYLYAYYLEIVNIDSADSNTIESEIFWNSCNDKFINFEHYIK